MSSVLLVETGHLYFCLSKRFPGQKLDYQKYVDEAVKKFGSIDRVVAFAGETNHDALQFTKYLQAIGYEVITKKPTRKKVKGQIFYQTNFAVEMVIAGFGHERVIFGTTNQDITPMFKAEFKEFGVLASGIPKNFIEAAKLGSYEITEDLLV